MRQKIGEMLTANHLDLLLWCAGNLWRQKRRRSPREQVRRPPMIRRTRRSSEPRTPPASADQQQHNAVCFSHFSAFTPFKGTDISIAPHSQKLTTEALRYRSRSFYTVNTPYLPLPRKLARWRHYWVTINSSHLIIIIIIIYLLKNDEAYYSFIDPKRMKGWVGLVGWPTADGLPI